MRTSQTLTRVMLTLVLAALLASCSTPSGDTATLRDTIQAQSEAQDSLRTRLTELEDQVQSLLTLDAGSQLRQLTTSVTDVADQVSELRTDVTGSLADAADETTALRGDLSSVSSSLDDLTATVSSLQSAINRLRDDLGSLEKQFQTHRDDPDAHG